MKRFERIHPRPDWATGRIRAGVPSLSSLFSSTKSFIDSSAPVAGSSRAPLPQSVVEMQRLRNANQANPTTGKREAQGGGSGVVDFVWHPSARVPVGVVCGGDRRIRFFNVSLSPIPLV
jgi:U3 small nucleolar RNA-associated protein 18